MAVIVSLIRIEARPYVRENAKSNNMLKEIKDGLKYIAEEKSLLQTILLIIVVGIFVFNYEVLIPVFTQNVLQQSEKVYGFLMFSLGIGSLLGAVALSVKSKSTLKIKHLILSSITVSALLILLSFTRIYYLTAMLLVVSGVVNIWFNTTANLTLQLTTKDEYRGRVMSVFSLVNSGTAPLGYMLAGLVSDSLGADTAFLMSGMLSIVVIILLTIFFGIRSAYISKA